MSISKEDGEKRSPRAAKTESGLQNPEVSGPVLPRAGIRGHPGDSDAGCPHQCALQIAHGCAGGQRAGPPLDSKGVSSSNIKGGMTLRQWDHKGAPDSG